ncbi:death-associated protein kinase 2 [Austrofundulus limnaeus]|uniref:Death-associated protein kinase 2 n=1 Tax=Austrofundulus limnaeus TaxID=52670 RepID=A0A2I4AUD0_AUSLI|nr:PREDICTED: death-associated protein kinase 2-like [Austrofundulus limnaeus]
MVKRLSVVNLQNFRRQYARRRWKLSFRIVALCNHLTRIMKKNQKLGEDNGVRGHSLRDHLVKSASSLIAASLLHLI